MPRTAANTNWSTHAPHLNPGDDNSVYPTAVNGAQLDACDHARRQGYIVVVDDRVREGDVLKSAESWGSEFETVTAAGEYTVGDHNVLRYANRGAVKRLARTADCVVSGLDDAIRERQILADGGSDGASMWAGKLTLSN